MNQDIHQFQQRFAQSIRTPLLIDEDGGHVQAHYYSAEILRDIEFQTELNMAPADRLAIYNQQYWFRLITTFQEEYPLTLAFCGLDPFNRMIMAYLNEFPSTSPYLRYLSQHFIPWLKSEAVDARVLEIATLDHLFIELFDAPDVKISQPLNPESLTLKPTVQLYQEHHPWVMSRSQLNDSEEYHEMLTELSPEKNHWVIERNQNYHMERHKISERQFQLLSLCQKHQSIPKAVDEFCETILGDLEEIDDQPAQQWFQHCFEQWGGKSWFVHSNKN